MMDIKHPDLNMSTVKVRKTKVDSEGNIFYVFEEQKLPTLLFQKTDKIDQGDKDSD